MTTTSNEHNTLKSVVYGSEKPLSIRAVKEAVALNSKLAGFLKILASKDVFYRKWDFDGDTFTDDFWTSTADTTATDFAIPATQELGGVVVGATGATSAGAVSLHGTKIFKGDTQAWLHVRFKIGAAVSNMNFEVGFIDAIPTNDATLSVISDIDTPAAQAGPAEIAVLNMDTSQTLKTLSFATLGSTTGMAIGKTTLSPVLIPVADTYMDVHVYIDGNTSSCIVDNKRAYHVTRAFSIEGGTLVMPWIFFRTRTTTNKTFTIDMIEVAGQRA